MSAAGAELADRVGPVLAVGDASRAVVAAIQALNRDVLVQDRGSYLRVLVLRRCVVTREAVEQALGRPFSFPGDLERIMPSFKGRYTVTEDEAVWAFRNP